MTVINIIKALIFFLLIIVSICCALLFGMTPAVPLIFLNRRLYFRWCSFLIGYYLLMMTCLLEDLFGIKIVVTGDDLTKDKKRSLIILNHRTRLDWMYIWMLHSRFKILNQLKIVLKSQLKQIPFFGWFAQHAAYLFIERSWDKDQPRIQMIINYYKSCQASISLLLFPEGTNLNNETQKKSNDYASKQTSYNTPYNYCLHPHLTGFIYLLNTMRSNDLIDTIDDVTIAYEGDFPITELDILKGYIPTAVHFHIKRYNRNDLPNDNEKIGEWLKKRWDEKEIRLKEFYSKNQFDSPSKRINHEQIETNVRFQRRLSLIFWILFSLFWSYCFIAFIKIKFYVLIVCLFHLVIAIFANGIIDFVCRINENSRQKRPAIKQD